MVPGLEGSPALLWPLFPSVCQNCVELDSATLAGIVITDVIATLLLALGVYCFAGHETGRLSKGKWKGQSVCVCVCMHMYVVGVGMSVHLLRLGLAVGCVSCWSHSRIS